MPEKRPEKKVLGRGLSSLIPTRGPRKTESNTQPAVATVSQAGENGSGVTTVSIDRILVNPRQPRRRFREEALESLSQSISMSGVLQPLVVRHSERGVELIAGERRLRAARRAGLKVVPVVFRKTSDQEQLEIALVENLQREDLNPMEEAHGYERLSRDYGMTQEEIAKKVSKDRSTVTNLMRLLKLSRPVQDLVSSGELPMGQARALVGLENPRDQERLAVEIVAESLSTRETERRVKAFGKNAAKAKNGGGQAMDPNIRALVDDFQRILGTKVAICARKGNRGEIRIQYFGNEDFQRIASQILRGSSLRS